MSRLSCAERKKVYFSRIVKVHYYNQTSIDSNVCWMQVARDRLRFKRRALEVEQKIMWVFATQHRSRMFDALYL